MGIEALFIHYSESGEPTSAATINQWHKDRDFPPEGSNSLRYIGYHWVIHRDGSVEAGRSDDVRPMHCPGWNRLGVIAVCLIGSDRDPWYPAEAQYRIAARFIEQYQPRQVWLHKEQYSTSCPGRFDKSYCLSLVGQAQEEEEDMISKALILQREKQNGMNVWVTSDAWLSLDGQPCRCYLNMHNESGDVAKVLVYTDNPGSGEHEFTIQPWKRLSVDTLGLFGSRPDFFSLIVKSAAPVNPEVTILKG